MIGGFDDISEESSYEFAMGREPTEMSRPATTTRAGARAIMQKHVPETD